VAGKNCFYLVQHKWKIAVAPIMQQNYRDNSHKLTNECQTNLDRDSWNRFIEASIFNKDVLQSVPIDVVCKVIL